MIPQPNICVVPRLPVMSAATGALRQLARVHEVPLHRTTSSPPRVLVTCCWAALQNPGPLGGLLMRAVSWALAAASACHPCTPRCPCRCCCCRRPRH